jgi:hypothetical protein
MWFSPMLPNITKHCVGRRKQSIPPRSIYRTLSYFVSPARVTVRVKIATLQPLPITPRNDPLYCSIKLFLDLSLREAGCANLAIYGPALKSQQPLCRVTRLLTRRSHHFLACKNRLHAIGYVRL